jgi:hypothetical protein
MALFLILIFMVLSQVQGTMAGGELPPRPESTATPIPTVTSSVPITGAAIQLHTSEAMPGAWTAVEWQNAQGDWYEVEGWRGHLDEAAGDMKTWWVYPANYGQGPFRWVVYASQNGDQLTVSDPFELPTRHRQVITIEVELP